MQQARSSQPSFGTDALLTKAQAPHRRVHARPFSMQESCRHFPIWETLARAPDIVARIPRLGLSRRRNTRAIVRPAILPGAVRRTACLRSLGVGDDLRSTAAPKYRGCQAPPVL